LAEVHSVRLTVISVSLGNAEGKFTMPFNHHNNKK